MRAFCGMCRAGVVEFKDLGLSSKSRMSRILTSFMSG